MLPYLVFIASPLIGLLLLTAENRRHYGETPFLREAGRVMVWSLGVLLAILAFLNSFALVWHLVLDPRVQSPLNRGLTAVTMLLALALIIYAARTAIRAGRQKYVIPSVVALAKQSQDANEVRLAGWLLVVAPLLLFGFFGMLLLLPLPMFWTATWSSRRSRETQFLWTLALAVENDLPLDDEIEAFSQTFSLWSRHRRDYEGIALRLREGRSLIDALEISGVLSGALIAELRAAAHADRLPQALRQVAARQTQALAHSRMEGSIAVTAVYLWAVLVTVFCLVGFVMYWIIPKFKDIFNDFGVELPQWTIAAIDLSDSVVSHFLLITPLIGLPIVIGLMAGVVSIVGWDNLNFPLLMRWFPRWDAPALLRGLAYPVESEQPFPESLEELAEHQRRSDLRERLLRMKQAAEMGQPIGAAMASEGFIRTTEAAALETASRAGNLEWAMRTLADSMSRTGTHRARVWLEFIKPAAVISLGCLVGFFVIAFFLPLVRLIEALT